MLLPVLGRKRVDDELEIGLAVGVGLVEVGLQSKQLSRRDGNLPLGKRQQVDFGGNSPGLEHLPALLVVDDDVVDDNTVEESEVDIADAHPCAQPLGQGLACLAANE